MKLPSYIKITPVNTKKTVGIANQKYNLQLRKWHPGFWYQILLAYIYKNKKK